ncbi:MAG TPA: AAA family ATPase [Thermoleophilaceae bacterium]|nr:AAA family ATPase [Thermoleophilaceae bacterium]
MALAITLLGPPRVERDGSPVTFDTRKAVALLAHLTLAARPRSRESLCALLWPAYDPERGRGALRRTLSTLRQGIGDDWIDAVGDSLAVRRSAGLELDVERFRALAADGAPRERLSAAAALFAGEFLEGFSLRDSPEFDDWQAAEADALERELASVLRRLVEQLAAEGDFEQAIPHARRWLELDRLHEPAHRELIRLYAWSGDRAAAFEQYRTCVRTLSQELGVAPLEETALLYEQLSDGRIEPPPAKSAPAVTAPAAVAGTPPELPLVGRDEELAALLAAHAAATPDGRLAVIEGEPGIGKTRLARELADRATAAGATVLAARCHDDEVALPYGPIVELLRKAVSSEQQGWPELVSPQHLADASLLLPELAGLRSLPADVPPLVGPGAQVRLLEGVAAVISAVCAGDEPGLVWLDDVHAADAATLDVISYLGRRLGGRALLIMVTWRSEAVAPGDRLRRLTGDLSRDGRATILRPGRLTENQVAALVHAVYPEPAANDLERRVYVDSEGLPLFVAEQLAALHAGYGGLEDGLPVEVRSVLDARLSGLSDVGRQVLGAASAIGRSFDLDSARQASGRSDEEAVAALEELVGRGLVRELPGTEPAYDFSHDKLRERVYEQTSLARRRLLHERVAAVLARRRPGGDGAAGVAHHLRLAGDQAGAAEQYRRAAEHAVSLHAHIDALEHLEAALALGYSDPAGVLERIGDLRTLLGDYPGALASYESAAAQCEPAALAAIEHKVGGVHLRRGEWGRAEARLEAALEAAPTEDFGFRARIHADLSLTLHHAGRGTEATAFCRAALVLAEAADDRSACAQAHNILGVLARSEGDPATAREQLELSLELARDLGDPAAEAAALNNLALVERDAGGLQPALALTEQALALCAASGDRHREAALENNLADLLHAAGDDEAAMAHMKRAVATFSEVGADEATRLPEIWKLASW